MNTDDDINYQIFTIIRVNLRLCFGVAQHGVERSGRFHIYKALFYHKLFFGGLIIIYIHIIKFDSFSQHSGMSRKFF